MTPENRNQRERALRARAEAMLLNSVLDVPVTFDDVVVMLGELILYAQAHGREGGDEFFKHRQALRGLLMRF